MKIVSVVGARPQLIKAAVVTRALRATPGLEDMIIHTGQHYDADMSEVFFKELAVPEPVHHLGVGSGTHGAQTGRMLEAVERTLSEVNPDWVLVYGDTNSTLAGALAAVKLHFPVAHIEAGLRSFNRRMPEEINRILTDHASDLLFAPTETAVGNLQREGIPDHAIRLVGDVMYDAAILYGDLAERESQILQQLGLERGAYLLATVHRAENTDDPSRLRAIINGLCALAQEIPVVLPLHPRTRGALARLGLLEEPAACLKRVIPPVGYLDMVMLERYARIIVTDSGGVQKEAFFHKVPCVTLRTETEWPELVELGWNRIKPPLDEKLVVKAVREALSVPVGKEGMPYGDGEASAQIVRALIDIDPCESSVRGRKATNN
ncbi:MAG: UDP-N-acetylglucosamine 2-epimerase (non-hydrolyzing) [Chloroflexi bacterium]|nr:UDP-N-acetylglucosamine 2-epimerase (non-hydrolyzing) [Chloroflexota bacterium]